jgi:hypothetical protein
MRLITFAMLAVACGSPGEEALGTGPGTHHQGSIFLSQYCLGDGEGGETCGVSASATFWTLTQQGEARPGCMSSMIDGCHVTHCGTITRPETTVTYGNAGALTISGRTRLNLTMKGNAYFGSTTTSERMWSPGESIMISGSGADVPAFSGQALVGPGPIEVTRPCGTDFCAIRRGQPYELAWTGWGCSRRS